MGIDTVICFKEEDLTITHEEFKELFDSHHPDFLFVGEGKGWSQRVWTKRGEGILSVSNWQRYYGPGYERGDLWSILKAIYLIRGEVNGPVWYGGDTTDEVDLVHSGAFTDLDALNLIHHWAGDPLGPYRRRHLAHNRNRKMMEGMTTEELKRLL
jgi:hypothetical protein